jgi:hypothetical protein
LVGHASERNPTPSQKTSHRAPDSYRPVGRQRGTSDQRPDWDAAFRGAA